MEGIIDLFASEYHWSKGQILNLYPGEIFVYIESIRRRKLNDLMVQLAVVQNPHTKKPKELWSKLEQELRFLSPRDIMDIYPEKGAFNKLSKILGGSNKGVKN